MTQVVDAICAQVSARNPSADLDLIRRCHAYAEERHKGQFRRSGEVEGKDYFFVTNQRFDQMIADRQFAEWAVVHGNRYGTSIATVESSLAGGSDCLFDVDYQGGRAIRSLWPADSVLCFILPPSMGELESRLRRRATDAPDVIERRLAMACKELEHYGEYDYLVVNDDLSRAYDQLRSIYVAARCARTRREAVAQTLLAEAASRRPRCG